jgi:hypothetical protein
MSGNITRGQEIGLPFEWRLCNCRTLTTAMNVAKKIKPATSVHHFISNNIITPDVLVLNIDSEKQTRSTHIPFLAVNLVYRPI